MHLKKERIYIKKKKKKKHYTKEKIYKNYINFLNNFIIKN